MLDLGQELGPQTHRLKAGREERKKKKNTGKEEKGYALANISPHTVNHTIQKLLSPRTGDVSWAGPLAQCPHPFPSSPSRRSPQSPSCPSVTHPFSWPLLPYYMRTNCYSWCSHPPPHVIVTENRFLPQINVVCLKKRALPLICANPTEWEYLLEGYIPFPLGSSYEFS